jgi:hypothetical protein
MNISTARLISQHIITKNATSVQDLVAYMGAMQAQDYAMAKFAVGCRLKGATDAIVEAAINSGEILRTHILRPTWHFVSANDIYWMLELTGPRITSSLRKRHQELELSESTLKEIYAVLEKELRDGNHLTKEAIVSKFEQANISINDNRAYHIFMRAELDSLICCGTLQGNKQTYALLRERVPNKPQFSREEALEKLARNYFTSHGPATISDFAWWSGLSLGDCRKAVGMISHGFISETIEDKTYWFSKECANIHSINNDIFLLPAYDEFLISYTDRKPSLSHENFSKAIYSNGIFRPIVVINGQVAGIWKRTIKKDSVFVEFDFFTPIPQFNTDLLEEKVVAYGEFLGKKGVIKI